MIVCALEYADNVNVDPSDWSKAYLDIANEKGITTDLKGKKGEAATRGDIAVMSYNGLINDLATPTASKTAGDYKGTQKIELSTTTKDADIYYTTDGTTPTVKSTKYTKAISVSKTSTLKAIAVLSGVLVSDVMSVDYTIKKSSGGGGGGGSSRPSTSDTSKTYTRGEWINILLNKINAEIVEGNGRENYYGDTEGHQYENAIESAKAYGIIPANEDEQDVPTFKPDDSTDREFASVTAVLAMGFVSNSDDIDCKDKSSLTYPDFDAIAVKEGFVNLDNGNFYPNRALTEAEKEQIFNTIDAINKSAEITEDIQKVTYSNNVIAEELKSITDYNVVDNGDNTYTVTVIKTPETETVVAGKYFVLPANDKYISGIALKANSVETAAEGYLKINASKPEDISNVMSNIVFSGEATAVANAVEVLDENITYAYDPEGDIENEDEVNLSGRVGGSFAVPGKWTFNFGDGVKIGEHAKLKGKTEVTIPDITAYLDADFGWFSVDVNELTVSITEKAKISGEFEYVFTESTVTDSAGRSESGSIEFARVPFALGATGLSIDLVFSLYYDVKGNISISYTVEATQGVQYKNDNFRFIHNFDNQLEIPSIEFSGQIGIQPAINLVFFEIWDIIGINGKIGAAATVSMENHIDEHLCCVDGTVYLAASIGLNQDTLIGDFLKTYKHYTLEKKIYDKNNSPLKLKLHFENLHKVPECTYGQGKIEGYVYDANTHEPIKYARISVLKGDSLKAVKYTNSEGKYTVDSGLPVGDVKIKISATGYKTYTDTRRVNKNVVTYIESYMMVGRSEEGQGNISGQFVDALTGENVSGVTYEIRDGWNNIDGEDIVISSTAEGSYNVDIPAGNYTILAKADQYIDNSINITVTENSSRQANITLSPKNGGSLDSNNNLRFVLTWGENPSDLDSHLFGPNIDGNGIFHTYFSNKDYYNNELIANLDLDDTTGFGPETTTIYKMNSSGKYSFYVHDYSNKESGTSNELSKSSAKVVIYNGNTRYATFNVPNNIGGTVWHVFDYDAATGTITPINTMSYSSDSSDLDLYAGDNSNISEQTAVYIIGESSNQSK